jgi:5-oxoprolinase (ATP-hydrolysing) subunit A
MSRQAEKIGVRAVGEAFADRAYTAEGNLVSRKLPGAVLHDPDAVAARAVGIATTGTVTTADGGELRISARSLCVHGDTPGAVELARRIREKLVSANVHISSFMDGD